MTLDKNLQQLKLLNPSISPVRSPVCPPAHMIQSHISPLQLPRRWRPVTPRTRRCQGRHMHFTPPRGEAWVGGGARH